jgi:GTP cyclohydrolase I
MSEVEHLTWSDISLEVDRLVARWADAQHIEKVYGVPQGGAPIAVMASERAGWHLVDRPDEIDDRTLVVDDLVDTGRTLSAYEANDRDTLYRKPYSPADIAPDATLVDTWLAFPWERDAGDPTDAVVRILQHIGEDPTREGLIDTPKRVIKAMSEMTVGYHTDIETILGVQFDVGEVSGTVVLSDIPFTSLCEHHMLPFTGTATVGYVPGLKVVGLSKLARLVDAHAKRLQVQERLTEDIATDLHHHLEPAGVGVVIHAHHQCMSCRGVGKPGATMTTNSLRGIIADDPTRRAEFMSIALDA